MSIMKKYCFNLMFQKKSTRKLILKQAAGIRFWIEY